MILVIVPHFAKRTKRQGSIMENEILCMQNITKIYDNGFNANSNVTLRVNKGEIHALVGENGAGKTTLMKILFGLESHQGGDIYIKGEKVEIHNPLDAIAHGIGMVHQHFMQVPSVTVAENVMLGIEPTKGLNFDIKSAIQKTQEISDRYQLEIQADEIVANLNVGMRQKVEILKALARNCDVLILDEPTAVLTPQETRELFVQLKKMAADGLSVIFISHKLEEVMELCNRITVLRAGMSVGSEAIENLDVAKISRMMVGRDVVLTMEKEDPETRETVAEINNLVWINDEEKKVIDGLSFSIKAGEIVGIAGVEGNGQTELTEILTGMTPYGIGSVKICGEELSGKTVREIRELGVASISEDRMKYGCAQTLSIRENIAATYLKDKRFRKGPFLDIKALNNFIDNCIKEYEIMCDDRTEPIRFLSGGNIQKVIVAREFSQDAKLIVASQPTRGIDVGTTEMIRKTLIRMTREKDCGVLLVSSDLNEILEVPDKLLVMFKGKIVAAFPKAQEVDEDLLGEYMLGIRKMSPEEMEAVL